VRFPDFGGLQIAKVGQRSGPKILAQDLSPYGEVSAQSPERPLGGLGQRRVGVGESFGQVDRPLDGRALNIRRQ
jgi:hypothetical protein